MLQKVLSPKELLTEYKKIASELLPESNYPHEVPDAEIQREIELLKSTLHNQRFMFVLNLHTMEIEDCYGVERWLGYSDRSFTLFDYLKLVHPAHNLLHQISSKIGISTLMKGEYAVEFMKQRMVTFISLRHKEGKYFLFKRVGSVFQYFKNKENKHCLLKYINEFTLVSEFEETPGKVTTFNENTVEKEWEQKILDEMKKAFEKENIFSLQEGRVLREYAYHPSISVANIAEKLNVKASSVATYHKRILSKAGEMLSTDFGSVKDVALFLKKQELI